MTTCLAPLPENLNDSTCAYRVRIWPIRFEACGALAGMSAWLPRHTCAAIDMAACFNYSGPDATDPYALAWRSHDGVEPIVNYRRVDPRPGGDARCA